MTSPIFLRRPHFRQERRGLPCDRPASGAIELQVAQDRALPTAAGLRRDTASDFARAKAENAPAGDRHDVVTEQSRRKACPRTGEVGPREFAVTVLRAGPTRPYRRHRD